MFECVLRRWFRYSKYALFSHAAYTHAVHRFCDRINEEYFREINNLFLYFVECDTKMTTATMTTIKRSRSRGCYEFRVFQVFLRSQASANACIEHKFTLEIWKKVHRRICGDSFVVVIWSKSSAVLFYLRSYMSAEYFN